MSRQQYRKELDEWENTEATILFQLARMKARFPGMSDEICITLATMMFVNAAPESAPKYKDPNEPGSTKKSRRDDRKAAKKAAKKQRKADKRREIAGRVDDKGFYEYTAKEAGSSLRFLAGTAWSYAPSQRTVITASLAGAAGFATYWFSGDISNFLACAANAIPGITDGVVDLTNSAVGALSNVSSTVGGSTGTLVKAGSEVAATYGLPTPSGRELVQLLGGTFRPLAGAAVFATYRLFSDISDFLPYDANAIPGITHGLVGLTNSPVGTLSMVEPVLKEPMPYTMVVQNPTGAWAPIAPGSEVAATYGPAFLSTAVNKGLGWSTVTTVTLRRELNSIEPAVGDVVAAATMVNTGQITMQGHYGLPTPSGRELVHLPGDTCRPLAGAAVFATYRLFSGDTSGFLAYAANPIPGITHGFVDLTNSAVDTLSNVSSTVGGSTGTLVKAGSEVAATYGPKFLSTAVNKGLGWGTVTTVTLRRELNSIEPAVGDVVAADTMVNTGQITMQGHYGLPTPSGRELVHLPGDTCRPLAGAAVFATYRLFSGDTSGFLAYAANPIPGITHGFVGLTNSPVGTLSMVEQNPTGASAPIAPGSVSMPANVTIQDHNTHAGRLDTDDFVGNETGTHPLLLETAAGRAASPGQEQSQPRNPNPETTTYTDDKGTGIPASVTPGSWYWSGIYAAGAATALVAWWKRDNLKIFIDDCYLGAAAAAAEAKPNAIASFLSQQLTVRDYSRLEVGGASAGIVLGAALLASLAGYPMPLGGLTAAIGSPFSATSFVGGMLETVLGRTTAQLMVYTMDASLLAHTFLKLFGELPDSTRLQMERNPKGAWVLKQLERAATPTRVMIEEVSTHAEPLAMQAYRKSYDFMSNVDWRSPVVIRTAAGVLGTAVLASLAGYTPPLDTLISTVGLPFTAINFIGSYLEQYLGTQAATLFVLTADASTIARLAKVAYDHAPADVRRAVERSPLGKQLLSVVETVETPVKLLTNAAQEVLTHLPIPNPKAITATEKAAAKKKGEQRRREKQTANSAMVDAETEKPFVYSLFSGRNAARRYDQLRSLLLHFDVIGGGGFKGSVYFVKGKPCAPGTILELNLKEPPVVKGHVVAAPKVEYQLADPQHGTPAKVTIYPTGGEQDLTVFARAVLIPLLTDEVADHKSGCDSTVTHTITGDDRFLALAARMVADLRTKNPRFNVNFKYTNGYGHDVTAKVNAWVSSEFKAHTDEELKATETKSSRQYQVMLAKNDVFKQTGLCMDMLLADGSPFSSLVREINDAYPSEAAKEYKQTAKEGSEAVADASGTELASNRPSMSAFMSKKTGVPTQAAPKDTDRAKLADILGVNKETLTDEKVQRIYTEVISGELPTITGDKREQVVQFFAAADERRKAQQAAEEQAQPASEAEGQEEDEQLRARSLVDLFTDAQLGAVPADKKSEIKSDDYVRQIMTFQQCKTVLDKKCGGECDPNNKDHHEIAESYIKAHLLSEKDAKDMLVAKHKELRARQNKTKEPHPAEEKTTAATGKGSGSNAGSLPPPAAPGLLKSTVSMFGGGRASQKDKANPTDNQQQQTTVRKTTGAGA